MKSPRRKSEIDQIAEKARALDQEGCDQILLVTNAARPHQGKKRAVHPSEPAAVRSTLSVPEPDPAVSAVPTQWIVVAKYQNPAHMLHAAAVHAEPLRITQRNTSAQVATVQRRPRLGYIDNPPSDALERCDSPMIPPDAARATACRKFLLSDVLPIITLIFLCFAT